MYDNELYSSIAHCPLCIVLLKFTYDTIELVDSAVGSPGTKVIVHSNKIAQSLAGDYIRRTYNLLRRPIYEGACIILVSCLVH